MKQRIYLLLMALFVTSCVLSQVRKPKSSDKIKNNEKTEANMYSQIYDELLPNTQKIFIIDSIVVDYNQLTNAISLPADYGEILPYDEFFNTKKGDSTYVYINGFGNKCFYSEKSADNTYKLFTRDKLNKDQWSAPQPVEDLDIPFTEINYPYMTADGTTLYFAAKSEDGLGGYDIYVTSYDQESGKFLKAENIGLPFNSNKDDFLYVEDDTDGIAWFASNRRQPEGKICIYTIALSATRQNYNSDIDETTLRNYAAITSIKDTWSSEESRQKAMEKLQKARARMNVDKEKDNGSHINFVINDEVEYTDLNNFSSDKNRQLYQSILKKEQQLNDVKGQLEQLRLKYHSAEKSERDKLSVQILNAEKEQENLKQTIINETNSLRKSEAGQI